MGQNKWVDRSVDLTGGVIDAVQLGSRCNCVLIRNPSLTETVYISLKRSVSATDYQAIALPGAAAILARPYEFDHVYLMAANPVPMLDLSEILSDSPLSLIGPMTNGNPVAQNVSIVSSVGLKPSDLNIEAVTKDLQVDVKSQPEADPSGWTWKKVDAAGAGTETVKATPGKVAAMIANAAETITLVDGAVACWKQGAYSQPQPIACLTSIKITFGGAGSAWILYK